jgi:hypothetical protein
MLQFAIARHMGLPVSGIVFDYVCTRPGREPRVKADGHLYAQDEQMATRSRYWARAEQHMQSRGCGQRYLDEMRARIVADGQWFQRYVTLRPDDNAMLTLQDVAQILRHIAAAEDKGYYPRSVNVLDCRLFCPYGKVCMAEYQLGHKSEARREEFVVLSNTDNWMMGRTG